MGPSFQRICQNQDKGLKLQLDAVQRPKFSVIMPVYNDEKYVGKAIESVLQQTYPSFELIVVDDGSTDGTPAILRDFEDHPKVIIIRQKNGGTAAARNSGLRHAKGEFCAFLDSDDFYSQDRLEVISRYIEEHERNIDCLATDVAVWNGENVTDHISDGKIDKFLEQGCTWENGIVFGSIVINAKVFSKIGTFNEKYRILEDREMHYRLLANGYKIPFLGHCGYYYRRGQDTNKTTSRQGIVLGDAILAAAEYLFKNRTPFKMRLFCLRSLQYLIRSYIKIKLRSVVGK